MLLTEQCADHLYAELQYLIGIKFRCILNVGESTGRRVLNETNDTNRLLLRDDVIALTVTMDADRYRTFIGKTLRIYRCHRHHMLFAIPVNMRYLTASVSQLKYPDRVVHVSP